MVTSLSPLADKRRDECEVIKPLVWLAVFWRSGKEPTFHKHTYNEGRLLLKLSSCGKFDFLLENMAGKSLIFFFLLEIRGSFNKEILGWELGAWGAKRDCYIN